MKKNILSSLLIMILSFSLFATTSNNKPTLDLLTKVSDSYISYKTTKNTTEYLFGVWPQTKKANNVSIDTSTTKDINGWKCYKGSDNCYYVKETAKPYDLYSFDDGTVIEENKEYYFLLEPIVWQLLDNNYQNGKLLVSKKILQSGSFCTSTNERDIYLSNYEKSSIRAWLNGINGSKYDVEDYSNKGFINKAFSKQGIQNIKNINVDNSINSTSYIDNDLKKVSKYTSNNTNDKIFLLSGKEVADEKYFTDDLSRIKQTTDYARAKTTYSNSSPKNMNNGWYWLRSPTKNNGNIGSGVRYDGQANLSYTISHDRIAGGIVPSLVIPN